MGDSMDVSVFPGTEEEPEFEIKESKPVLSTPSLANRRSTLKDSASSLAHLYDTVTKGVLWRILEASTKTQAAHARSERRVSLYRDSLYILNLLLGLTTLFLISRLIYGARQLEVNERLDWDYKAPPLISLVVWFVVALITKYYSGEQKRYEAIALEWCRLRDSCESLFHDIKLAAEVLQPAADWAKLRNAQREAQGFVGNDAAMALALAQQAVQAADKRVKAAQTRAEHMTAVAAYQQCEQAVVNVGRGVGVPVFNAAVGLLEAANAAGVDVAALPPSADTADQHARESDKALADAHAVLDSHPDTHSAAEIAAATAMVNAAARVALATEIADQTADDADFRKESEEEVSLSDIQKLLTVDGVKIQPAAPAAAAAPALALDLAPKPPVNSRLLSSKELWRRIAKILKMKITCDAVLNGVTDQDDFNETSRLLGNKVDGVTIEPSWEYVRQHEVDAVVENLKPILEQPPNPKPDAALEPMVLARRRLYRREIYPLRRPTVTGHQVIVHPIGGVLRNAARRKWIEGHIHGDADYRCCDLFWFGAPIIAILKFVSSPFIWCCECIPACVKACVAACRSPPPPAPAKPPREEQKTSKMRPPMSRWAIASEKCGCGSGYVCGMPVCQDTHPADEVWRPDEITPISDTDTVWLLRTNARLGSRLFLGRQHNLEKIKWISTLAGLSGVVAAATLIVPSIWDEHVAGEDLYKSFIAPLIACFFVLISIGYVTIARRTNRYAVAGKAFLELFERSDALYYQMIAEYANPNLPILEVNKKLFELKALKRFIIRSFVYPLAPPFPQLPEVEMHKHWKKLREEASKHVSRITALWRHPGILPVPTVDQLNSLIDETPAGTTFAEQWFGWCPTSDDCPGCCGATDANDGCAATCRYVTAVNCCCCYVGRTCCGVECLAIPPMLHASDTGLMPISAMTQQQQQRAIPAPAPAPNDPASSVVPNGSVVVTLYNEPARGSNDSNADCKSDARPDPISYPRI